MRRTAQTGRGRDRAWRRLGAVAGGVALAAGVFAAIPTGQASAAGASIKQSVAVPAYFGPGSAWTQLSSAASRAGLAVANPSNGAGGSKDSGYASAIQTTHGAGTKVLGYVDTGYLGTSPNNRKVPGTGSTNLNDWITYAEQSVDAWYSFYGGSGLDGIFFDDVLGDCGPSASSTTWVDAYKTLQSYVKTKHTGAMVVDNPGGWVAQCYTQAADTLITYEGSYSDYASATLPDWEATADPKKVWHLVYGTSQSQMQAAITLSKQRNAGYVYVTNDVLDNPWDTLPSYWSAEVTAASAGTSTATGKVGPVKSGIAGYCLDVPGNSGSNSAKVSVAVCNTSAEQQWTTGTDGTLKINNKCLDVRYNATANGSMIDIYDCNGQSNQKWNVVGSTLVGAGSGRCLDDPQFFTDGHQLEIYDCNGGNNQKWTLP
ncbi:spherulation-specific family 4 protein [Streptomyces sp. RKAG337]|uniref:spherulation-specific family 4 protein n=1 Tax=Streptomyces sp. RKAG337 TaxID=2893404 RepID=UPI0020348132|nr:spherulation-specific family 4 protein [Streptomyces sp. RKAG337]MCM2425005.1 ricin-type beta-trefoil lectin domain protein [Streptomyces sp. RKAG337]